MAVSSRRGDTVPGALKPGQTDTIVRILVEGYPELEAVHGYGSAAGEALGKDSDVDVAVLLPGRTARATGALAMSDARFRLEEELSRRVDLVNARTVSVVVQKEIITAELAASLKRMVGFRNTVVHWSPPSAVGRDTPAATHEYQVVDMAIVGREASL
jgi:predicted nucleotidyltransferase